VLWRLLLRELRQTDLSYEWLEARKTRALMFLQAIKMSQFFVLNFFVRNTETYTILTILTILGLLKQLQEPILKNQF
jgi:hypothetical protein